MEERAAGKFDAWKEQEFEEFWGQKQKLDYSAIAGESAKLKLDVLLKNNYFKVGDEWSYSRVFGRGGEKVHVEKDGTVCSRCPSASISLSRLTMKLRSLALATCKSHSPLRRDNRNTRSSARYRRR